jgi:hypothetical protein
MTNKWELQVGCYVNKDTIGKFYGPLAQNFIERFCDDIEVKILMIVAFDVQKLDVELEVDFNIGSPQGPGFFVEVIAGGGFTSSNKDGDAYMAKFGFGVGYKTTIATFNAQAHCDIIGQFIKLPQGFDVGGSVRIQAEIDFGIVRASATVEGGLHYRQITCTIQNNSEETKWHIWQMTMAVEVHIFWVVDIEFQYQMQNITNDNGGHCDFGPDFN